MVRASFLLVKSCHLEGYHFRVGPKTSSLRDVHTEECQKLDVKKAVQGESSTTFFSQNGVVTPPASALLNIQKTNKHFATKLAGSREHHLGIMRCNTMNICEICNMKTIPFLMSWWLKLGNLQAQSHVTKRFRSQDPSSSVKQARLSLTSSCFVFQVCPPVYMQCGHVSVMCP